MPADTAKFVFSLTGCDPLSVVDFTAHERVSAPFVVDLSLASEFTIAPADAINNEALLTVESGTIGSGLLQLQPPRYFSGIIRKFRMTGVNGRFNLYTAQMVPDLARLSLRSNCRIFQQKNVQEIVSTVLQESGLTTDDFEFRLQHEDRLRKYCVQFQESDFHFVSRLLEEEGIFYFFEHSNDGHLLVFSDTSAFYRSIPGTPAITFNSGGGLVGNAESISSFTYSDRLRPGKFSHRNYNFKTPGVDLTTLDEADSDDPELYEFPGLYGEPSRGNMLAKARMEAVVALKEKATGQSCCCRITSGATFTLTDHSDTPLNKDYLVIEAIHAGTQPGALSEHATGGTPSYGNDFLAIPATTTFRPSRLHAKPVVPGIQTAVVTGPPGEEIYPDEYGRVKVQFPWDREGQRDEKTTCWLRVAQFWNGTFWGSQFIPRIGDEVLVAFLNGDVDYPLIVGSAINEDCMPVYPLPANKTVSGIRTKSYPNASTSNFHELRFEDKKGSEEIYLQSEKDWNILVKNDKGQTVGHDETLQVKNNRTKVVGVNQLVDVGANHTETIGANKSITVKSNKTETVYINSAETIGAAKELTIGGLYQVSVGGVMNETVGGAKAEEVGITKAVLVGSHMKEKVVGNRTMSVGQNLTATITQSTTVKAKTILLEASDEIVFKTGNSMISMKSNGDIVIKGATIQEKASGEIVVKGSKVSLN